MNYFTWIQNYVWEFCVDCELVKPVPVHVGQCSDSRNTEACNLLPMVTNDPLILPYKILTI